MATKPATKPFDQAVKFSGERNPKAFLSLIGCVDCDWQAGIKEVPPELSISTTFPDLAYEATVDGEKRIIHIEAQTVYDRKMPDRMLDYANRLMIKYNAPVYSYVLLLTDRKAPKELPETAILTMGNLQVTLCYPNPSIMTWN